MNKKIAFSLLSIVLLTTAMGVFFNASSLRSRVSVLEPVDRFPIFVTQRFRLDNKVLSYNPNIDRLTLSGHLKGFRSHPAPNNEVRVTAYDKEYLDCRYTLNENLDFDEITQINNSVDAIFPSSNQLDYTKYYITIVSLPENSSGYVQCSKGLGESRVISNKIEFDL